MRTKLSLFVLIFKLFPFVRKKCDIIELNKMTNQ